MRIISDVHNKYSQYFKIIKDCDYSFQLGDMGLDYTLLRNVDSSRHKFIFGNHSNIDTVHDCPNFLGDYGYTSFGGLKFFYYSGAFSVDKRWRQEYHRLHPFKPPIWWANEELDYRTAEKALKLYKEKKPDLVLSHDCPWSVAKIIGNPDILREFGYNPITFTCITQDLLEECFSYHQPVLHFFGHHHHEVDQVINGTRFICRPELGWTDINPELKITDASIGLEKD